MKALKISIAIVVVAAIVYFVIWSLVAPPPTPSIALSQNQFTKRIEQEIESLGKLPDSKFCKDVYENIKFLIDDYHKQHPPQYPYGRLGNTQAENNQRKENFEKELYSTYAAKFIKQAFYVLSRSEWNGEDLGFIRNEYQKLRRSDLLEKGSPVDKQFMEIQNVFNKYDEIVRFISTCDYFSYSTYGLSDRFPISDAQNMISRGVTYRNNRLENEYVNNCTRLHDRLKEIPQILFREHVRYLDMKITKWSGKYSDRNYNINSQSDYNAILGKPIQNEIDALNNRIYNVVNFNSEHKKLSDKWNTDKRAAYEYKYPTID